ncbi:MAG: alpha-L-fucosidase [Calditrichae bacterium]|nr:alpha-L-fucosidase [Calditrichia bacterium]
MKIFQLFLMLFFFINLDVSAQNSTATEQDKRMQWWREARFGMFIHWGLYAIPAGEWKGETGYGEWIRTSAEIPLEEYNQFINQFNPVNFDADQWVKMAKNAGMKYIVITSKHHDGFCLWDSKQTDFDVMSSPFKRDIMKELAEACRKNDMKICWYHSIMDWHHPDYLPRRNWETDRSSEGADFDRYVDYMKAQLKELLTNYGDISVLWFDGEWESTWTRNRGKDLYDYVRSIQPDIIINNRVGAGRSGMEGLNKEGEYAGDFGTPEQQIPATGLPGVDWETCMTMNSHWGWNKNDTKWKSTSQIIQMLADIASKGGNYLLNVGPKADGTFPQKAIDRLQQIGDWMKTNGEAIYGTTASPFKNLNWGRCTQKPLPIGTRLYLHVFDWPKDNNLVIPGIFNEPVQAYLLAEKDSKLKISRNEDALTITIPEKAPDLINSVVVLDIEGKPDVSNPPIIFAETEIFIDSLRVHFSSDRDNIEFHYTVDGSEPTINSPKGNQVFVKQSSTVKARSFRNGKIVSSSGSASFKKVSAEKAAINTKAMPGLAYSYYEGKWDSLPDFSMMLPKKTGVCNNFIFDPREQIEEFGFVYEGYIQINKTGVYTFFTDSDDGSRLYINNTLVADNDGLHSLHEESGAVALQKGLHLIKVTFFENSGGDDLIVSWKGPDFDKQLIPEKVLFHAE